MIVGSILLAFDPNMFERVLLGLAAMRVILA